MRERYVRHFFNNVIELADDLAAYYVQDCFCDRAAFFGVELMAFFDHHHTVDWLRDCIAYDRCGIHNLRSFLAQGEPRRYMVHSMNDHQVMDQVARVIVDYDYPVVIHPLFEPPWRESNTIDVICAIQNGAPLSVISRSPELDNAVDMLKSTVQNHPKGAVQSFQQNLLAINDIDPNDRDTARSPWDVERWKREHQLRLSARRQALLPHSPQGWNDPDAPTKVVSNVVKILAGVPGQILQHPIDSLIIEPIKEFVGMFKTPKADTGRDQARHDVLGRYYQSKDIEANDLDTADHPSRAMQLADGHDKRHRNDRTPAIRHLPPPEDTEKILAMMITFMVAKKIGKAVARGSGAMAEESAVTAKPAAKAKPGTKGMPEAENPKAIKHTDNKVNREYGGNEKGPKKTSEPKPKRNKPPKKTAVELYADIRNSKTDVADIAKHNNLKPERIQKIKDYVFENQKHTPHKPTAEAWQRLSKGMGTEHDKLLLKHETAEMFYNDWIKKNPTKYMERYEPLTSHDITNYKGYDWEGGLPKE